MVALSMAVLEDADYYIRSMNTDLQLEYCGEDERRWKMV
jgi:hypothetical protein